MSDNGFKQLGMAPSPIHGLIALYQLLPRRALKQFCFTSHNWQKDLQELAEIICADSSRLSWCASVSKQRHTGTLSLSAVLLDTDRHRWIPMDTDGYRWIPMALL